jgi:uncharacterized protein with GYD domain
LTLRPVERAGKTREERVMAKYLITASYTADGMKGLHKDKASGRRDAVRQACESIGGKLEAFYFAFGGDDVVTIVDLPDNVAASALSLAASATGSVRTRTTALLTVDEVDKSLAAAVKFRGAGA